MTTKGSRKNKKDSRENKNSHHDLKRFLIIWQTL